MSYKQTFTSDTEYMEIVNNYKAEKEKFDKKVEDNFYDKDYLQEEASRVHGELSMSLNEIRTKRMEEARETMAFASKPKDVGYADRPGEVKEFEMKFKLAADHEITDMIEQLNSEDVLELNILRQELKNRGMNAQDETVRTYINRKDIGGMNEGEQSDYDFHKEKLKNYRSVGTDYLIVDDELQGLSHIKQEMSKQISNKADRAR